MTNLLVEVRIKPNSRNVTEFTSNSIVVGSKIFTFSKVHCKTTQQNLCVGSVQPFIDKFIEGQNCTIMAYGQTGSGKTYTMGMSHRNEKGIVQFVLDAVTKMGLSCRCSFIEIYNEEIYDLLSDKRDYISLRQQGDQISLVGLTEIEFSSYKEGTDLLKRGCLNRTTKSTKMNSESSRSHALFSITYLLEHEGEIIEPTFYFVDLAGSERLKRTECVGKAAKESISINAGLLSLGNVISALYHKKSHIPYRDSKLTRILQKCLNTNALLIACVSGLQEDTFETSNTLKYASRAAMISLNTKVHVENDKDKLVILNLKKQISSLKEENNRLRTTTISKAITDDKIRSHPLVIELIRRLKQYEGDNVLEKVKSEISQMSDLNNVVYTDSYINHLNNVQNKEKGVLNTNRISSNRQPINVVKFVSKDKSRLFKNEDKTSYDDVCTAHEEHKGTTVMEANRNSDHKLLEKIRLFNEQRSGVFNFNNPNQVSFSDSSRSNIKKINLSNPSAPNLQKGEEESYKTALELSDTLDESTDDRKIVEEQIRDMKIEDQHERYRTENYSSTSSTDDISKKINVESNNEGPRKENHTGTSSQQDNLTRRTKENNYNTNQDLTKISDKCESDHDLLKNKLFYANIENLNLIQSSRDSAVENAAQNLSSKKRIKLVTFDLNPKPKCTLFTPLKESKNIRLNQVNVIYDQAAISLVLHKEKLFFNCIDSKIRCFDNGVTIAVSDDSIRCLFSDSNLYYSSRSLLKCYNEVGRPMPVFAYKNEISALKVYNNYILTGHDDGTISFLDKRSNRLVFSEKIHSSTVFDAIVLNNHFFSGSRDHSVKFNKLVPDSPTLQFESPQFIDLSPPHYDSVNTVLSFKGKCITMGRDASIKVWNEDKPFKTVPYAHDTWIKAGYATDAHIFTGCKNGTVKAWDFISQSIRSIGRIETGSCINSIVANKENLWVSCQNKTIQQYEISI